MNISFHGWKTTNGIAGSCGNSAFNLLRDHTLPLQSLNSVFLWEKVFNMEEVQFINLIFFGIMSEEFIA